MNKNDLKAIRKAAFAVGVGFTVGKNVVTSNMRRVRRRRNPIKWKWVFMLRDERVLTEMVETLFCLNFSEDN